LKRDELASIGERLEDGNLQLSTLAVSGEGGFGFQDEDTAGGVGQKAQGLAGRGAEQGRALLDKARQKIAS
jgi:hypothetical protein